MQKLTNLVFLTLISTFAASAIAAPGAASTELRFERQGREEKTLSQEQLKTVMPPQKLSTFEPEVNKTNSYNGWPILELLEKIYGPLKDPIDTVVFHCVDGYRADIALKDFKDKQALLAFAMSDGSPFVLKGKSAKPAVALAPYYLVWNHPTAEDAQRETYRWPYAVNKIEVIDQNSYYRPILPALPATPEVQFGHTAFVKHCVSCHTVNAVGGLRGPPLNIFAQTKESGYLQKYMLNPKSVNKSSQMPGLSKTIKDRNQMAKAIAIYLKKTAR